jgi:hypothetical protein
MWWLCGRIGECCGGYVGELESVVVVMWEDWGVLWLCGRMRESCGQSDQRKRDTGNTEMMSVESPIHLTGQTSHKHFSITDTFNPPVTHISTPLILKI